MLVTRRRALTSKTGKKRARGREIHPKAKQDLPPVSKCAHQRFSLRRSGLPPLTDIEGRQEPPPSRGALTPQPRIRRDRPNAPCYSAASPQPALAGEECRAAWSRSSTAACRAQPVAAQSKYVQIFLAGRPYTRKLWMTGGQLAYCQQAAICAELKAGQSGRGGGMSRLRPGRRPIAG